MNTIKIVIALLVVFTCMNGCTQSPKAACVSSNVEAMASKLIKQAPIDKVRTRSLFSKDTFFYYYSLPTEEDQMQADFLRFYFKVVSNNMVEGIIVYQSNMLGSIKFFNEELVNPVTTEFVDSLYGKSPEYLSSKQFFNMLDKYDYSVILFNGSISDGVLSFQTHAVEFDGDYLISYLFEGKYLNNIVSGVLTEKSLYTAVDFGDNASEKKIKINSKIYYSL